MLKNDLKDEKRKRTFEVFVLCNDSAIFTEMTKGDFDIICLRHVLYIYKPEKDTFE